MCEKCKTYNVPKSLVQLRIIGYCNSSLVVIGRWICDSTVVSLARANYLSISPSHPNQLSLLPPARRK